MSTPKKSLHQSNQNHADRDCFSPNTTYHATWPLLLESPSGRMPRPGHSGESELPRGFFFVVSRVLEIFMNNGVDPKTGVTAGPFDIDTVRRPVGGKIKGVGGASISSMWAGGAITGTTPDGRLAGKNLADGTVSPSQGKDTHGPPQKRRQNRPGIVFVGVAQCQTP